VVQTTTRLTSDVARNEDFRVRVIPHLDLTSPSHRISQHPLELPPPPLPLITPPNSSHRFFPPRSPSWVSSHHHQLQLNLPHSPSLYNQTTSPHHSRRRRQRRKSRYIRSIYRSLPLSLPINCPHYATYFIFTPESQTRRVPSPYPLPQNLGSGSTDISSPVAYAKPKKPPATNVCSSAAPTTPRKTVRGWCRSIESV
jgi:hypothetical protein